MIRNSLALSLAALATAATAQTPAPPAAPGQPADQPASKPPAEPKAADLAAVNAMLAAPLPADQAAMKAHVLFLASDAMKGREAGSPEYDIAAQYVAAQFYAAGLRPAGDAGGYLQRVPLVTYRAADQGAMTWTPRSEAPRTLAFREDFVPAANPGKAETMVTAPVVFVGYGVRAPGYGHDDYAGVDVRGKIVAFFAGAPVRFEGEERAFFGSAQQKTAAAAERGAVGTMTVEHPTGPASRSAAAAAPLYDTLRMTWAKPDGTGNIANPGTPPLGLLSARAARTIFGEGWAAIDAAARRPDGRVPSVTTAGTVTLRTRTSFKPGLSSNVVGMIPGSDPKVGKEVVVLSAHLDHIGVSTRGDGDRINNGALDNAIGIASLIEEAKRFAAAPTKPKRTVVFLAVTAEEKGLIGSDYFAEHPTVPLQNIVADVNLDMPILLYPFEDMVAFGGERSTLGPIIRRAVAAIGVALSPDPMPAEGIFVRSDHFRFVQKGIPSVFLWPGQKGAGKAAVDAFMAQRYHKPGDDLNQPILWDQGVRFVDANYRIAREIADAATRPVWNKGDYFGTLYKGPMAR